MWCGFDQLTWRSQPWNRQPLSRTRKARILGGETVRVSRPTSITIESASRTRDIVQSQARRSAVRTEMGSERSSSAGGAPSSPFKPSSVMVRLRCGLTPWPLGKAPWALAREESPPTPPLVQVAERGGGLKGDLTGAERSRDLGQRLQLLPDTYSVSGRADRHAAGAGDPGSSGDVAGDQVLTSSRALSGIG